MNKLQQLWEVIQECGLGIIDVFRRQDEDMPSDIQNDTVVTMGGAFIRSDREAGDYIADKDEVKVTIGDDYTVTIEVPQSRQFSPDDTYMLTEKGADYLGFLHASRPLTDEELEELDDE